MTKKDYVLIAKVINNYLIVDEKSSATLYEFADYLASELYYDNEKFKKEKFMKACGF